MAMKHISTYTEEKSKQLSKGPRFVRWAVMLGIVIVLNIFFMVIRGLVFPEPMYTNYCPAVPAVAPISTQSTNELSACNNAYQAADAQYQMEGFVVLVGLGLLAIIIGVLPLGSSIVSTGLSYGGVLAFVIASAQYWSNAGNWLRLAISVIALIALIYIGFKRFRD